MTGKTVPQTDCDQHLTLFCEGRNSSSNPPLGSFMGTTLSSNNRGVFCSLKDKTIVARGLPYPLEYTADNFNAKVQYVPFKACRVTRSIEGPVIIVFYHMDQWYLSTNRKINAFKSYWADPKSSFGLMFAYGVFKKLRRFDLLKLTDVNLIKKELDKVFDKHLDKSNRYIFIQPPTFNERLVTTPSKDHSAPVLVATFVYSDTAPSPGHDRLTKIESNRVPFADMPTQYKLPSPASCDLYKHVCNLANKVDPNEAQGILIEVPNGTYIKVLNSEYSKRLQLRGTVSSLKGRYMQLRHNLEALVKFTTYYPEVNSKAIEIHVHDTCSVLETLCYLVAQKVQPDHIGTFLENKGHLIESIALSKVIYTNLLEQKTVMQAIQDMIHHPRPYASFQRLSVTNTPVFNNLSNKIKFQTTKAKYAIKDDIQSQIEFLNSLDVKSFFD